MAPPATFKLPRDHFFSQAISGVGGKQEVYMVGAVANDNAGKTSGWLAINLADGTYVDTTPLNMVNADNGDVDIIGAGQMNSATPCTVHIACKGVQKGAPSPGATISTKITRLDTHVDVINIVDGAIAYGAIEATDANFS